MNATCCPYCGVVTDVPHESQALCIEALHVEIARMRGILEFVKDTAPREEPAPPEESPPD